MKKSIFIISFLLIGTFSFSSSSWGTLFPEFATNAPVWLKEGLRISFYAMTATIKPGGGLPDAASSGAGILQVDIVALEEGNVVLLQTYYPESKGQYFPSITTGGVEKCGICDYWMNPFVFKHLDRFQSENSVAAEMPFQMGGKTIQGVRIEYKTESGKNVYMYDKETGVLLYWQLHVPSGGNVQSSHLQFISSRLVAIPWVGINREITTVPAKGYTGAYTVNIPGSYPTSFPMQVKIAVVASGKNWDLFKTTVSQYDTLPSEIYNVCGNAQLNGPLWIPIAALAQIPQDQILDYDELTKIKTSVIYKGTLDNHMNAVVIQQSGANFFQQFAYNLATGKLSYMKIQTPNGFGYNTIELEVAE